MNALTSPKHEATVNNAATLDLDFFTKKPENSKLIAPSPSTNDDVMVDICDTCLATNNNDILNLASSKDEPPESNTIDHIKNKAEIKPLTDINVTLESVQPSKLPPMTAFEEKDGLTVVLHFCKDKPRADVNVVVISTTSRSGSPIDDYKLQCVVPRVS